MKATDVLTSAEIQALKPASDFRGWLSVLTSWSMIAACFALVAWDLNPITALIAVIILGGRHLALAILMHECAHYSLFKTRKLNDWVGHWLCASPTWQDLRRYRPHHLRHHQWAGSDKDPDMDLVAPFPVSKASLKRKLLRDISGLSGIKRIYGLIMMDLGYIEYTVSSRVVEIPGAKDRSKIEKLKTLWHNAHGVILTNLALLGVLCALGIGWTYFFWILGFMTTFSVFVRIRSIAEHACTQMDLDPYKCTRTINANWLARVTVAPHHVNYHLEHHLLMTVPHFRLPKFRQFLESKGALESAYTAANYREVLRLATAPVKA